MKLFRSELYLAQRRHLRWKTLIVAAVSMLTAVVLSVWSTSRWVDRQMRDNLLQQSRMVLQLISLAQVKTLTGTERDLSAPNYLFIKKQLMDAREANSRCRFLYLLGRKTVPAPAGASAPHAGQKLFFLVDSEPADSKDYSAPGEEYDEANEHDWRVFDTQVEATMGPESDRWGTWVSALVPMVDPATGKLVAVLGQDIDARTWNRTVAAYAAMPAGLTVVLLSFLFGVLFTLLERSDRRLAEQQAALRSIEERLMSAIEQSGEIIVITDSQGTIQYVNPAFVSATGYSREEAIGQNPRILKSGQQDEAVYRELWQTITSGKIWKGRFVNKRKDGTFYTEDASISPVRDVKGQIVNFVAVKRDITEHLQMTDNLLQAQKMESVGRLAGGIAHDFNNMLTVILGNAELALKREDPAKPHFSELLEIRDAAERSAELTKQLLTWQPCDETIKIKMDPSQINQILANLAVNARFATAGTGKLTIETQAVSIDRAFCAQHMDARPGNYAVLVVSDNGCGMDKQTIEHIFEPFFTTKRVGEGTGLGLATIYGIVKQNYGFANVYSEPGVGTTFKIYLPRCKSTVLTSQLQNARIPASDGDESVLLVEDEPAILNTSKAMLQELGYQVYATTSADEALRIASERPGGFHLLLTDMVMPKMNGQELSKRLLARHPHLKCLFMSGYSAEVIMHHGMADKRTPFIQKPFTSQDLGTKLREVLDN